MVAEPRNRFLVALVCSIPIVLWSPIGSAVFGLSLPVPFGWREDVWTLPVIGYSYSIFVHGAVRALRARVLDMMVLVAVAVSAGRLCSLVTLIGGEVFYEAATVPATFVLLGYWVEMHPRGGANDAIRALLGLAPPRAVVLRVGAEVEIPTTEVVGGLLLVRPRAKITVDGAVEHGESEVGALMVTGKSLPVHKGPGSAVIGATINANGVLRVRATKVGAVTAPAKIVHPARNFEGTGPAAGRPRGVLARVRRLLGAEDVDLGNPRITVAGRVHPLDDLTYRALHGWLAHRRDLVSAASNPHQLINRRTAATTAEVGHSWLGRAFRGLPATLERRSAPVARRSRSASVGVKLTTSRPSASPVPEPGGAAGHLLRDGAAAAWHLGTAQCGLAGALGAARAGW
ncbi:hypothetical protein [Amycolatopsis sp. FDAARGOS 1241]|uniref:P-type ATPase n=1 Tax=Amycolatopsis sp. FDAARGOS 1241 TaxID=2778070 RepID=UPI001EF2BD56|nr:hypothetical protein [Amycolatopsis sp. FDAARGOS 1241]